MPKLTRILECQLSTSSNDTVPWTWLLWVSSHAVRTSWWKYDPGQLEVQTLSEKTKVNQPSHNHLDLLLSNDHWVLLTYYRSATKSSLSVILFMGGGGSLPNPFCSQYLSTRPWRVNSASGQVDFQFNCPDGQDRLKHWENINTCSQ